MQQVVVQLEGSHGYLVFLFLLHYEQVYLYDLFLIRKCALKYTWLHSMIMEERVRNWLPSSSYSLFLIWDKTIKSKSKSYRRHLKKRKTERKEVNPYATLLEHSRSGSVEDKKEVKFNRAY
jgi:hypothetical protein